MIQGCFFLCTSKNFKILEILDKKNVPVLFSNHTMIYQNYSTNEVLSFYNRKKKNSSKIPSLSRKGEVKKSDGK